MELPVAEGPISWPVDATAEPAYGSRSEMTAPASDFRYPSGVVPPSESQPESWQPSGGQLPFAPAATAPEPSWGPGVVGAMPYGYAPSYPLAQNETQEASPAAPPQPIGSHVLGIVTIAVGVGAAVGTYYGGPFGGVAGSLFGGAIANVYKAGAAYRSGSPDGDHEAKVSASYAIMSAALGGWVAYKFAKPRHGFRANPEEGNGEGGSGGPSKTTRQESSGPCRPRKAYPVVAKACEAGK
jgi:hypothetical protein